MEEEESALEITFEGANREAIYMLLANARKSLLLLTPPLTLLLIVTPIAFFYLASLGSSNKVDQQNSISSSSSASRSSPAAALLLAKKQNGIRPVASTSPSTYAGQQQDEQDRADEQMQINIVLARNNFILTSRCSRNRVHVRVSKRSKTAFVGAKELKQVTGSGRRAVGERALRDSARMSLLSMLITFEHVPGAQEPARQEAEQGMPVRLRSNLTQLYICFNMRSSKLEAKVSKRILWRLASSKLVRPLLAALKCPRTS